MMTEEIARAMLHVQTWSMYASWASFCLAFVSAVVAAWAVVTWRKNLREEAANNAASEATNVIGACDRLVSAFEAFEKNPNKADDSEIKAAKRALHEAWRTYSRAHVVLLRYKTNPQNFRPADVSKSIGAMSVPEATGVARQKTAGDLRKDYDAFIEGLGTDKVRG